MTDLRTLLEVGGPLTALGGGAAYTRAKHPAAYWSTIGLPISTTRLLSSYGSVMEACGLTVAPSRLRVLAVKATTRREVRLVTVDDAADGAPVSLNEPRDDRDAVAAR